MKLSYFTLAQALQGINVLLTKELNYKAGLNLSHTSTSIQKVIENYETENKKLAEQYLEKDENGEYIQENGGLKLKEETKEEYWEKKQQLDEFEVEIEVYPIKVSDLDGIKILPSIANSIEFLVEE